MQFFEKALLACSALPFYLVFFCLFITQHLKSVSSAPECSRAHRFFCRDKVAVKRREEGAEKGSMGVNGRSAVLTLEEKASEGGQQEPQ